MSRYSKLNELTFRRNFSMYVDWVELNLAIIHFNEAEIKPKDTIIGAVDCSFISKSGTSTFGKDNFWSGVESCNKKGLEVSLFSLIDTSNGQAWSLDITQTPANLSSKEGKPDEYTRMDFYAEQVSDLLPQLQNVEYLVADGYYAKKKFMHCLTKMNKHLITKFRPDANLRYLLDEKEQAHGNKKYDGKVNWKNIQLDKWVGVGRDKKYPHLHIYTQVLNSPYFKRNFRVVMLYHTKTKKYVVLASTDVNISARQMVFFYQLRFQIEFLFRDAKQLMGLNHCQARDQHKLDFHFNMSMTALNLARLWQKQADSNQSINSLRREAYNTKFTHLLLDKLKQNADLDLILDINLPDIQEVIQLGTMNT
ncbi:transposase [uncultured Microscilla sp.]|uniref:transposase n=1 Tax=uncultured Microscilla sp. TaxID=432653 RepID=UPI00260FB178|nr:transposase [uncultured Microscilla sp.]